MKTLILIFLFAVITSSVNAQSKNSMIFGEAVHKYKNMEITGTVLTVLGGVTLFTGNILYWKSYNGKTEGDSQADRVKKSGNLMLAGIGIMAVGIPLWAVAKSKERHISIEAEVVRFKGLASANGVGLKINF